MASNRTRVLGRTLKVTPTDSQGTTPGTPSAGDPTVCSLLTGVCLNGTATDGTAIIDRMGVYNLAVKGENESGNAAIAVGDIVYFDLEAHYLNSDATDGVRFGYALAAVASGATTTIPVALGPA